MACTLGAIQTLTLEPGTFQAQHGYDLCTGLGVPNAGVATAWLEKNGVSYTAPPTTTTGGTTAPPAGGSHKGHGGHKEHKGHGGHKKA